MRRIGLAACLVFVAYVVAIGAQTNAAKPGPEYNVLDAWTGNWIILGG